MKKTVFPEIDTSAVDLSKVATVPFSNITTGGYFMRGEQDSMIYQKCQKATGATHNTVVSMGPQSCWSGKGAGVFEDSDLVYPINVKIVCST